MLEMLLSFVGSFVLKFALGWLEDKRNEQAQRDIGRLTAERDQALAGLEASERLAAESAKVVTEDDAIKQMNEGKA